MRKPSKKALAVVTTAGLLAGGGTAFAYWTTLGAGTGSATSGDTVAGDAIVLAQSGAITGLYPGGPAADIDVTANNPAAFTQVVGQVTVTVASYPGACGASNWTLTNVSDTFGSVLTTVTTAAQKVGTIALNETGLNQDVCKSVTPTFAFASAAGA